MQEIIKIPLYKRKEIVDYAIVSLEDYEHLNQFKWALNGKGYAYRREYTKGTNKFKRICMHKEILPCEKYQEIDHINLDRLDNRRKNLRIVTRRENMFNKNMYSNNKCGYKGVYFKNGSYRAEIGYDGVGICLGSYSDAKDGALAYNIMAKKLFGEYANLNKLDEEFVKNNEHRIKEIMGNVGKPKGAVKYRGVWLNKRNGKYVAEISKDGTRYCLGEYLNPKDAAAAYNDKAIILFGEKAKLNEFDD